MVRNTTRLPWSSELVMDNIRSGYTALDIDCWCASDEVGRCAVIEISVIDWSIISRPMFLSWKYRKEIREPAYPLTPVTI